MPPPSLEDILVGLIILHLTATAVVVGVLRAPLIAFVGLSSEVEQEQPI